MEPVEAEAVAELAASVSTVAVEEERVVVVGEALEVRSVQEAGRLSL